MVLLKKVNNANPGDADHVGGNDWDKLADYYNDIDTAEVPRINTLTEYRSGILKIRDGSNVFNVAIKSATQTANRDFSIPALIGNDSPATLALANNFTAVQQVTLDADTLLNLYRPVSTTNTLCGLGFYERNSSNAGVVYSGIYNRLITNTAGDEDGKLVFYVRKDGVLTEVGSIDKNGLLTIGSVSTGGGTPSAILADANIFTGAPQTISNNSAVLARLYRPATTATNLVGLDFQHQNASATQTTYGRISTELVTNTAADEDGKMHFYVMKDGTLTDVMNVDKNGLLTVASVSSGGATNAVTVLLNTGVIVTTTNTSSEYDLLNYSVPGNTLGLNGALRIRISGYMTNNSGSSANFTLSVYFGGTVIYQDLFAVAANAANYPFLMEFEIGNKNATNSQGMSGKMMLQDAASATTGEGDLSDDEQAINANFRASTGASTKDTTSAQVFKVTMTLSTSSSTLGTSVQRRMIEFLPGA